MSNTLYSSAAQNATNEKPTAAEAQIEKLRNDALLAFAVADQQGALLFQYAEANGFSLIPLEPNSKIPVRGSSWKENASSDPAEWQRQRSQGVRNFGIAAGPSNLIIVDLDTTKEGGLEGVWKRWCEWCKSNGLPTYNPQRQSARKGLHFYFKLPDGVDASSLTNPDIASGINIKVGWGYTVAPGSYYDGSSKGQDSGFYFLFANAAPPYDAPDALIEHCTKKARTARHDRTLPPAAANVNRELGRWGRDDGIALFAWCRAYSNEHPDDEESLDRYKTWKEKFAFAAGWEWGEVDGREVIDAASSDPTEMTDNSWASCCRDYTGEPVKLASITKWAKDRGWTGTVRQSGAWMFRDVVVTLPADYVPPSPQLAPVEPLPADIPLRVISAASFAGKPVPVREELVEGLIPASIAAGLYGEGAVGKSLLALMLAISCVTGTTWLGRRVKQGPVIYLCCEDDEDEVHRRLAAICRFLSIDLAALGEFHIVPLADDDAVLAATDGRSSLLTTTYRYDQVVDLAERVRPVLVIGDTLADILAATENDRMVAKQFVRKMRPLAVPYGGTFLVLAHPSLSGITSGRGSSGTTGWRNTFRWDGYLRKVTDEGGRELDPKNRLLQVMKANYGPQDGEIPLRYVEGCYIVDTTRLSNSGGDPLATAAKAERVFIDLLKKYIGQNRYVSTSLGKSYAPAIFATDAAKEGVNKGALKAAMERLLEKGAIENAPHGSPSKKQFRLYPKP